MSKIYGFGNALIDIEIQINDDQLSSIGIPKGNMQHINKDKKDLLLNEYKDFIRSKNPGGSIANSLFAAENYGASTYFSCSIGDDEEGHLFLDSYSDKKKVLYNFSEEPTGVCLVFITPDGERTMASNLSANYQLTPQCINPRLLESCNYLLFDNFSLATDSGNKTALHCLDLIKNNTKVCFGLADSKLISQNLKKIKNLSNQPIYCLSGNKLEHNVLNQHMSLSFENRLITHGVNGASINGKQVSAPKINLVNTNGAGDSLIGAYIALEEKIGQDKALEEAVNYSSEICSVNGPRLK